MTVSLRCGFETVAHSSCGHRWGIGFAASLGGTCPPLAWRTSLLSTHAHRGEEGTKSTTPCVLSSEYPDALRKCLEAQFLHSSFPRMASLEILDEPHLMRANVCHCQQCRQAYRERFGCELPTWDEALAAGDQRTADYFEWVVDYAAEAFRQGYEIWQSLGPGPQLHHVLCAIGSGNLSARHGIAEDLPWTKHADFVEFDCYNYMYPNWRCSLQLRWNQFHYLAGHFRFLARRQGQRFGFWIQVTDREVPVAPYDPLRAPSETLYTAIGAGAKSFHLMCKGPFSNTQNCREEKFDTFAADICKVQTVAPLLERAEPPCRRLAMIFPFHDRLYRAPPHSLPPNCRGLGFYGAESRPLDTLWPYHMAPINVAELLCRAFGEVDVIDQRALREGALDDYHGCVITGADYMAEDDASAVRRFVESGGALICDHVPGHNLAGQPLAALAGLFGAAGEPFYREVRISRSSCGKGTALLFSHDLNELYSGSIEQGNQQLRCRLEETVHSFLFGQGLRPHAGSGNVEVEANVLLTPDTLLLVAVNHAETRQRSQVTLYDPPVPAVQAFDLVTMRPYTFARTDEGLVVDLDLGEREGLILGFYQSVPVQSAIKLPQSKVAPGGRLAFHVELLDAAGNRARGDHIVEVQVSDSQGDRRRQFGGLLCATNGHLAVDEPLALNARRGKWTITAFERFSTRLASETVTVG